MNNLQNLHTHSTYCDGKHTPEQMVEYAIKKGFDSLGFSAHSYMFFSPEHSIKPSEVENYKNEITGLKEKYKNELEIFLGLEVDMYSQVDLSGYDYLIGSCHYFKFNDEYVGFDRSAAECQRIIKEYFGGDGEKFALEYYKQFSSLCEHGKFDILGHFDVIAKNNEKVFLFDENSKVYLNAAFEAIDAFKGKVPLFEVNTGSIGRGYKTMPYPSVPILKRLKECGFGAVISSDCHDGEKLDCNFDDARELLKQCGFKERYILTQSGFKAVEI